VVHTHRGCDGSRAYPAGRQANVGSASVSLFLDAAVVHKDRSVVFDTPVNPTHSPLCGLSRLGWRLVPTVVLHNKLHGLEILAIPPDARPSRSPKRGTPSPPRNYLGGVWARFARSGATLQAYGGPRWSSGGLSLAPDVDQHMGSSKPWLGWTQCAASHDRWGSAGVKGGSARPSIGRVHIAGWSSPLCHIALHVHCLFSPSASPP